MKLYFDENHENEKINVFELEDMTLIAQYITKNDDEETFRIIGNAIIDDETFNSISVEVALDSSFDMDNFDNFTIEDFLDFEWDWYDYLIED